MKSVTCQFVMVLHSMSFLLSSTQETTPALPSLQPFKFNVLDAGQLQPAGWVKDQLQLEADGLAGHLFDFYRYVKDSTWLGGAYEYSELHESAPYWYRAVVPLAYQLQNQRLIQQVNEFLDYVLDHQATDGWLGPETTPETRGLWARFLLLQGMADHAHFDPNKAAAIVDAVSRFVDLSYTMLSQNFTGFIEHGNDTFDPYGFGKARAHEFSTSLQVLYDRYPAIRNSKAWEVMQLMWQGAVVANKDWRVFFTPEEFPRNVSTKPARSNLEHGVSMAEGVRFMAQLWRMEPNVSLIEQTRSAIDMTFDYHVGPAGTIIADEYLGGLSPQRGSELCMSVELIYSLLYLYRLFGFVDLADKAELTAFNAFPAAVSTDWWSHQYVTQTNQPWSRNLSADPFYNVVSYSNTFGLEPNFPCCTVNHGLAYPHLASSALTKTQSGALLHQILVPFHFDGQIGWARVSLSADTNYPFGSTIHYSAQTDEPFDFLIRVPSWAQPGSSVQIPDGSTAHFRGNEEGHFAIRVPLGSSEWTVAMEFTTRVVPQNKTSNTVSIYRGPLLYSLDIETKVQETPALNWTDRQPLPASQLLPQVHDHIITPAKNGSWQVAIDPSTIKILPPSNSTAQLPNPVFDRTPAPAAMTVNATYIDWPVDHDTASLPPNRPVAVSETFVARLIPYGCAKLHIAEFPVLAIT